MTPARSRPATTPAALRELVVRSPRPDALAQWYRDALGLGGSNGVLRSGSMVVRIEPARELATRVREPIRLMPNFVVDDADAVEQRLIGMGATWVRELETTPWARIATVLDPDGGYVQVLER
jgi:hypothetical protein